MHRIFRARLLCFLTFSSFTFALGQSTVPKFLYVVNYISDTVSVFSVEPLTGQLTEAPGSPYPGGIGMQGLAFRPDNKYLYASGGNSVIAYGVDQITGALTQIGNYDLPSGSGTAMVTPDGKYLYTMGNGIAGFSIDATNGTLTPVPGSPFDTNVAFSSAAATPNTTFLYASALIPNGVYAYSIQPNGELFSLLGSPFYDPNTPYSAGIEPAGRYLYIANYGGGISGWSIDPVYGGLTELSGSPYSTGGDAPNAMAVVPDGRAVVVDNQAQSTTSSLAIQPDGSLQLRGTPQPAGANPNGIAVDPTSQFVYTSATTVSTVSAYRLDPVSLVLEPVIGTQWATGNDPYAMQVLGGPEAPYCPLNNVEPSVTVCAPTSSTASPVEVIAGTTSASTIQQMQVLVDGAVVFRKLGSNALDEFIDVGAGTHTISVQALNLKHQTFSSQRAVAVSGTGSSTCSARGIFPTVAICSPLAGSTNTTSIHVVAQSTGVTTLSSTVVYLDGRPVYSVSGSSVDTYVNAPSGSHRITVQSTGTNRTTWGSTVFVNVQ
jgi:6-phosphogluconolactonase (cycloisomerase 2 family)